MPARSEPTSVRRPYPTLQIRLSGLLLSAFAGIGAGCSQMPQSGPHTADVRNVASDVQASPIQVIDIDDSTARRAAEQHRPRRFAEELGDQPTRGQLAGPGDEIEVTIWESPPAALFGSLTLDPRVSSGAAPTILPAQAVDGEGQIQIPFAGRIQASGQTPNAMAADITRRLQGKANRPQVMVRIARNVTSTVTVVGEVQTSASMPLTSRGERVLDALAAVGGVRQPVDKVSLQLSRGERTVVMPLNSVIRDPRQNVTLRPGDVLTALNQPLSFTALGATGKNEEVVFETQGISLAQALARVGGLLDVRSDAKGVFIFRMENPAAMSWQDPSLRPRDDQRVPVVYRLDLSQPRSFFTMQDFVMADRDVLYVANAPAAELQKFLNIIYSTVYPLANLRQAF